MTILQRVLSLICKMLSREALGFAIGAGILVPATCATAQDGMPKAYTVPTVDLASETHRQVVVDREPGQYLGHPSTLLLPDNKTILITYPKGHGKGAIVYKKSFDGGLTWTERLATPDNWATSREVPTLFRLIDPRGVSRVLMFSGKPVSFALPTRVTTAILGHRCALLIRLGQATVASWLWVVWSRFKTGPTWPCFMTMGAGCANLPRTPRASTSRFTRSFPRTEG